MKKKKTEKSFLLLLILYPASAKKGRPSQRKTQTYSSASEKKLPMLNVL